MPDDEQFVVNGKLEWFHPIEKSTSKSDAQIIAQTYKGMRHTRIKNIGGTYHIFVSEITSEKSKPATSMGITNKNWLFGRR